MTNAVNFKAHFKTGIKQSSSTISSMNRATKAHSKKQNIGVPNTKSKKHMKLIHILTANKNNHGIKVDTIAPQMVDLQYL